MARTYYHSVSMLPKLLDELLSESAPANCDVFHDRLFVIFSDRGMVKRSARFYDVHCNVLYSLVIDGFDVSLPKPNSIKPDSVGVNLLDDRIGRF